MKKYTIVGAGIAALSIALVSSLVTSASSQEEMEDEMRETVMDSQSVLLDMKVIPAGDFIHLYDSTPAMIKAGHIAAKLPCDANGESALLIVVGVAPDVAPLDLELVEPLSTPGKMCIYHGDLPPEEGSGVTDVAILNPTEEKMRFPRTSTVVISVSEIERGEPHG
ncbi:MAG: hypothetical protein ACE5KA_08840 [Nitrososphaerales archaeon]